MYGVGQSPPRRRGPLVIVGVAVLVLVLIGLFIGFYSLVLNNDDNETPTPTTESTALAQEGTATQEQPEIAPTDTATSVPVPATATTRPTAPATNTAQPTATLKPPPEVITTGVRARVNISDGLAINLRDLPTLSGSVVITQLVAGSEVDVIGGPEDEADLRWWSVDGGKERLGWVVEGYGGETWLVPVGWSDELPPISPPAPTVTPTVSAPEATPVETETATPTLEPTVTAEATAEATAAVTATATPALTPTATVEGEIPSPQIGGRVRVTTRYEFVNLRSGPGLGAETIGQLADATIASVLEGPEEADDITWWKVDDGQGNTGWAAERVGKEVLLVPVP
jgi:uncharacterized protein YgiM (DUF1202 family)